MNYAPRPQCSFRPGFSLEVKNSRKGVLLFHGLTSTPTEMEELGAALHAKGFHVEVPLLPGHGKSLEDLQQTLTSAWTNAASTALHQMFARGISEVHLAGVSFGALLALHLGETAQKQISSMALLSLPLKLRSPKIEFVFTPLSLLPERYINWCSWYIPKALRPEGYLALAPNSFPAYPASAVARLMKLRRWGFKQLKFVRCPIYLSFDPDDHLIQTETVIDIMKPFNPLVKLMPGGQHELLLGHRRAEVIDEIIKFFNKEAA